MHQVQGSMICPSCGKLIGVGEGIDDLQPFAARDFARAIAGLDS